jgi:acetyl esterase
MRSIQRRIAVTLFIFSILGAMLFARGVLPKPDDSLVYKQVDGLPLHLDLFKPASQSKVPSSCIVFFHGGGWSRGAPRQFYRQAAYLASKGMLAISVEYRTRRNSGATPLQAVMDAKSAMRWIREHASTLNIDPHKIAAAGGSAGGQLAVATAVDDEINSPMDNRSISARPDALILYNPVIDNGPGPGSYGYRRVANYWKTFSPMHNIKAPMPPTLILIGDRDHLIPLSTIKTFTEKVRATGARCDLYIFPGANHGFFNKEPYRPETLKLTYDFLRSIGFID